MDRFAWNISMEDFRKKVEANIQLMVNVSTFLSTFMLIPLSLNGFSFHHKFFSMNPHRCGEWFTFFSLLAFSLSAVAMIVSFYSLFSFSMVQEVEDEVFLRWYARLEYHGVWLCPPAVMVMAYLCLNIVIIFAAAGLYGPWIGETAMFLMAGLNFVGLFFGIVIWHDTMEVYMKRFKDGDRSKKIASSMSMRYFSTKVVVGEDDTDMEEITVVEPYSDVHMV